MNGLLVIPVDAESSAISYIEMGTAKLNLAGEGSLNFLGSVESYRMHEHQFYHEFVGGTSIGQSDWTGY